MSLFVTPHIAGKQLGLDVKLVRQLFDSDKLAGYLTPGGHRRISTASIQALNLGKQTRPPVVTMESSRPSPQKIRSALASRKRHAKG